MFRAMHESFTGIYLCAHCTNLVYICVMDDAECNYYLKNIIKILKHSTDTHMEHASHTFRMWPSANGEWPNRHSMKQNNTPKKRK